MKGEKSIFRSIRFRVAFLVLNVSLSLRRNQKFCFDEEKKKWKKRRRQETVQMVKLFILFFLNLSCIDYIDYLFIDPFNIETWSKWLCPGGLTFPTTFLKLTIEDAEAINKYHETYLRGGNREMMNLTLPAEIDNRLKEVSFLMFDSLFSPFSFVSFLFVRSNLSFLFFLASTKVFSFFYFSFSLLPF